MTQSKLLESVFPFGYTVILILCHLPAVIFPGILANAIIHYKHSLLNDIAFVINYTTVNDYVVPFIAMAFSSASVAELVSNSSPPFNWYYTKIGIDFGNYAFIGLLMLGNVLMTEAITKSNFFFTLLRYISRLIFIIFLLVFFHLRYVPLSDYIVNLFLAAVSIVAVCNLYLITGNNILFLSLPAAFTTTVFYTLIRITRCQSIHFFMALSTVLNLIPYYYSLTQQNPDFGFIIILFVSWFSLLVIIFITFFNTKCPEYHTYQIESYYQDC